MCDYFADSKIDFGKDVENFNPDRPLFRKFNFGRPKGHSANHIYRDKDKKEFAIRCNCGSNHLLIEGGVDWENDTITSEVIKMKNEVLTVVL